AAKGMAKPTGPGGGAGGQSTGQAGSFPGSPPCRPGTGPVRLLRRFGHQDVRVDGADAARVRLTDEADDLCGVRLLLQQGPQGFRVEVGAHLENDEAALDRSVVALLLLLQDPEPQAQIIQPAAAA